MRSIIGRLSVLLLALMLVPAAAHADDELGLSNDGSTWNGTLEPLFDSSTRWVPGDTREATFHARNQSSDGAEFSVVLVPKISDLYDTGLLQIQARADGGDWTELGTSWTSPELLAAQDSTQIDVRATLLPNAENPTQALTFSFDVGVRLTYTGPNTTPTPTTPSEPTSGAGDENDDNDDNDGAKPAEGSLAGTGADYPSWLLPAGFGALITGLWLALAARRRHDDESEIR